MVTGTGGTASPVLHVGTGGTASPGGTVELAQLARVARLCVVMATGEFPMRIRFESPPSQPRTREFGEPLS